jgi:hypothetical protein
MIHYALNVPYPCELIDQFTVRKSVMAHSEEAVSFMQALCKHLMDHPDPLVVPVYGFQRLSKLYYSYDMMRLGPISKDDRQVINALSNIYVRNRQSYLDNQSDTKLIVFLRQVIAQKRYWDLHGSNVMQDDEMSFRLVDLEGMENLPLDQPENDWITR